MSSECSNDCASCSSACDSKNTPNSFLVEPNPKSSIGKIIGVVSGKGGVGKSLVTELLADTKRQYLTQTLPVPLSQKRLV